MDQEGEEGGGGHNEKDRHGQVLGQRAQPRTCPPVSPEAPGHPAAQLSGSCCPSQGPLPPFSRHLYSVSATSLHFTSQQSSPAPPLHPLLAPVHPDGERDPKSIELAASRVPEPAPSPRLPWALSALHPCTPQGAGAQAEPNGGVKQQQLPKVQGHHQTLPGGLRQLLEALLETVTRVTGARSESLPRSVAGSTQDHFPQQLCSQASDKGSLWLGCRIITKHQGPEPKAGPPTSGTRTSLRPPYCTVPRPSPVAWGAVGGERGLQASGTCSREHAPAQTLET